MSNLLMTAKAIFLISILFSCHVFAQDIEVKGLKTISESSANAIARKDINGNACGLVRVQLKEPDAQFSGNVLGNVEYKNGEYWVYMATGSKRLDIKHTNYLPITVVFADYGVKKLASGAEYQMMTKANKEKPKAEPNKKGMAAIQITPSNASLSIDGRSVTPESGGVYTLSLPYGTHYYSVQYGSFAINNQMVKIDKTPKTIKVDLTEYFARLSIDCQEKDASIYINDELKGVGSCEEMVIPDKYVIRVEKEGYHPLSQTVTLEDNEEFRHSFPKMDAIAGTLKVEFDPIGATVYLDGKEIGVTPLQTSVVPGHHKLEIKKENCPSETRTITITENQELVVKGSLKMTYWALLENEAAKGDGCAMAWLGYYQTVFPEPGFESDGPCTNCFEKFSHMATDLDMWPYTCMLDSGIEWFLKAIDGHYTHTVAFGKYSSMLCVSACYAYKKEYDKAFYWTNRCAQEYQGYSGSPYMYLAWFYYYGKGVGRDVAKARQILQKTIGKKVHVTHYDEGTRINSIEEILNDFDEKMMPGIMFISEIETGPFPGLFMDQIDNQ